MKMVTNNSLASVGAGVWVSPIRVIWLIVLAFVFLIPGISFAQSIPPSTVQQDALIGYRCSGVPHWPTADQACQYTYDQEPKSSGYTWSRVFNPPSSCQIHRNGSYWVGYSCVQVNYCADGSAPSYGKCNVKVCPSGYKMNFAGTMCDPLPTCPPNTVWNEISQTCRCENGSDVGDDGTCCPQPGEALAQMQKCEVYSTSATTCQSSNENGCAIRCNQVQFQIPPNITGGDGVQITDGIPALGQMCKYTGSKANAIDRLGSPLEDDEHAKEDDQTKPKPPPKTPEGCMAAGMGYVTSSTGSTTCVKSGSAGEMVKNSKGSGSESGTGPSGPKPGTNSESNKSESKGPGGETKSRESVTTNNADGSKTTKTTETKCVNGVCEKSETIETRDKDGNLVDSNTKKESGTKDDFCTKNPNDLACRKQDSKFSGSCKNGFACEGDAATCAIAQAAWKSNCALQPSDQVLQASASLMNGTDFQSIVTSPGGRDNPNVFNLGPIQSSGGGGGQCPANINAFGFTVDLQQFCWVFEAMGWAMVISAWLIAAYIIGRGI